VSSFAELHHLGSGSLEWHRDRSVFINCPFDKDFKLSFDALVFSTICCGFIPRCAIESGSAALPRMDRIVNALCASKYSVHDLSRCRGEGDSNFARFNMPLELGIAMAQSFSGDKQSKHDWLLLVPRGHAYKKFVSDLAGYDPTEHDGTLGTVVSSVMSWLTTRPEGVKGPTPEDVLAVLPVYQLAREKLNKAWHGYEPWRDILFEAGRIGREKGLIP